MDVGAWKLRRRRKAPSAARSASTEEAWAKVTGPKATPDGLKREIIQDIQRIPSPFQGWS